MILVSARADYGYGASTATESLLKRASGCITVRVMQLSPRLLAGTCGIVLGHTDIIATRAGIFAIRGVQRLIFDFICRLYGCANQRSAPFGCGPVPMAP